MRAAGAEKCGNGGEAVTQQIRLRIEEREDFVIVTSYVLSALICRIRGLTVRRFTVAAEEILPNGLEEYLRRIINTNRYAAPCFRYSHIREDPIEKEGLYRILGAQLTALKMEKTECFRDIVLTDTMDGAAAFDIVCTEPFFLACRDLTGSFLYTGQDGAEEALVPKYGGARMD